MRALVLIALGFAIGVLATVMTLSALRQGTPLSHGSMAVTRHHYQTLRAALADRDCRVETTRPRILALRMLADDFEDALLPSGNDALMRQYSAEYRATLDALLAVPPENCAALEPGLGRIKERCDFCHRDFR